jgi:hypothetical protein
MTDDPQVGKKRPPAAKRTPKWSGSVICPDCGYRRELKQRPKTGRCSRCARIHTIGGTTFKTYVCQCGKKYTRPATYSAASMHCSLECRKEYGGIRAMAAKFSLERVGDGNPGWRGDDASSASMHSWIARNHPKTGVCEECGKAGKTEYAFNHHVGVYTRNRDDYRELCRGCHLRWDYSMEVRKPRRAI